MASYSGACSDVDYSTVTCTKHLPGNTLQPNCVRIKLQPVK